MPTKNDFAKKRNGKKLKNLKLQFLNFCKIIDFFLIRQKVLLKDYGDYD